MSSNEITSSTTEERKKPEIGSLEWDLLTDYFYARYKRLWYKFGLDADRFNWSNIEDQFLTWVSIGKLQQFHYAVIHTPLLGNDKKYDPLHFILNWRWHYGKLIKAHSTNN